MPSDHVAQVSFTELDHFRRLVRFLTDTEDHARETDDYTLLALVDDARHDLEVLSR